MFSFANDTNGVPACTRRGTVALAETYCAATDGRSAARIEEEVVGTATGCA
jgi:putative hemolysin